MRFNVFFYYFFFFVHSLFLSFLLLQLCIPLFCNLCCSASITTLILNISCIQKLRYDMYHTIKINYVIWQIVFGMWCDLEMVEPLNALKLSFVLDRRLISSLWYFMMFEIGLHWSLFGMRILNRNPRINPFKIRIYSWQFAFKMFGSLVEGSYYTPVFDSHLSVELNYNLHNIYHTVRSIKR